nr:MAG TPA: hypothetical protein [Caudoviricetes sp.]
MKKYSTDSRPSASCNAVTIRELEPDESASTLYGMTYDVQLTTCGRICGIGHFCKTLEEAKEWADRYFRDAPKVIVTSDE